MPGQVAPFTDYQSAQCTEAAVGRQWDARLAALATTRLPADPLGVRATRLSVAAGAGPSPALWHGRAIYSDAEWRVWGLAE